MPIPSGPMARRASRGVLVQHGERKVWVGGDAPVVVQSMTNTDTADAIGTAIQVKELARAGSEIVRITVDTPAAAAAVPAIREQLDRMEVDVPLVGDFHYNGHLLLRDFPECAQAVPRRSKCRARRPWWSATRPPSRPRWAALPSHCRRCRARRFRA